MMGREQLGSAVQSAVPQPGVGETGVTVIAEQPIDATLIGGAGRRREGQSDGPQVELEQPVALAGLKVVIALGRGLGNDLDLPGIEAEGSVEVASLRLVRPGIG